MISRTVVICVVITSNDLQNLCLTFSIFHWVGAIISKHFTFRKTQNYFHNDKKDLCNNSENHCIRFQITLIRWWIMPQTFVVLSYIHELSSNLKHPVFWEGNMLSEFEATKIRMQKSSGHIICKKVQLYVKWNANFTSKNWKFELL